MILFNFLTSIESLKLVSQSITTQWRVQIDNNIGFVAAVDASVAFCRSSPRIAALATIQHIDRGHVDCPYSAHPTVVVVADAAAVVVMVDQDHNVPLFEFVAAAAIVAVSFAVDLLQIGPGVGRVAAAMFAVGPVLPAGAEIELAIAPPSCWSH